MMEEGRSRKSMYSSKVSPGEDGPGKGRREVLSGRVSQEGRGTSGKRGAMDGGVGRGVLEQLLYCG